MIALVLCLCPAPLPFGTLFTTGAAHAAECAATGTRIYSIGRPGRPNNDCEILTTPVPATITGAVHNIAFVVYSLNKPLTMTLGVDVVTTMLNGSGAIALYGNGPQTSVFEASNRSIDFTLNTYTIDPGTGLPPLAVSKQGVDISFGASARIGSLTLTMLNLPSGQATAETFFHLGVQAGSSANTGEVASTNGRTSSGLFGDLDLTMAIAPTYSPGTTLNGLRALQGGNSGNGSNGVISVANNLTLDLDAGQNRAVGVFVSGGSSRIDLHDSDIRIVSSNTRAEGLQIGYSSLSGRGTGLINSTGQMLLDMTDAPNGAAILMNWQGAQLVADGADASTEIRGGGTAIRVNGDRLLSTATTSTQFRGLVAENATAGSTLIDVAMGQADYRLGLLGLDNALLSSGGGWLIDVAADLARPSNMDMVMEGGWLKGLTRSAEHATLDMDLQRVQWQLTAANGIEDGSFTSLSLLNSAINAHHLDGSTANFSLRGDITNQSSVINLANGVAGDTLTIDGDYVSGGGEWRLDASLTGTGATVTDQVIITGDTVDMGADRIRVDNLALTDPTGLESVRLIRVDGISAASFVLLSRVVQGAYEYVLSQHDDGGWYLDSFMHVSPDPVPPVVPVPPVDPTPPVGPIIPAEPLDPGDPTDPVDPSDPVDPVPPVDPEDPLDPVDPVDPGDPVDPTPPTDPVDPTVPIPPALPEDPADPPDPVTPPPAPLIRPEIGAHAANLLGATELIGMSRADRDGAMRIGRGAWFQIQRQTGSISTENDQLDTDFSRHSLLAGADLLRFSTNGRDDVVIGAMAGYGRQSSDTVSALTGFATDAELTGHALGVYAAWAEQPGGAHGWYVDGWASLGRFDAEIEGEGFDPLDYDLSVARLSLEAGYGFEIWQNGRAGITLQPQAQLTLSHIGSERFTDNSGARIRMGGNAMQSRLGLRAAYRQAASTAFLQLDWLRWLDRPELRIDDYRADQGGKDALRVGLGYQHRWSDRGQAEFRVDHTDLSDGNSLATSLKLNYRF